jgi:hypothetical protein
VDSFGFYANNFLFNIKATGNVGIGTESPAHKLDVRGGNIMVGGFGGGTDYGLILTPDDSSGYWNIANITGGHLTFNNSSTIGSTTRMKLDGAGTLTVSDDLVAFGSPSDKRLKENIKPIESALDKVSKLQGVTFNWKEKGITNLKQDVGFIAQDVQKVVPELVRENENGMLSMRHQGVAPILLEAIKELKAEVEELKKQIK